MPPTAVRALAAHVSPSDTVLELGGGRSTSWFADRADQVIVIEDDPEWAAIVRGQVGERSNVMVIDGTPDDHLERILGVNEPEVVVVDHKEQGAEIDRVEACTLALARKGVRVVVLDDSDRYEVAHPSTMVRADYRGFRSFPLSLTQTTLFTRPRTDPGDAAR